MAFKIGARFALWPTMAVRERSVTWLTVIRGLLSTSD
jgi:hypothetical protein